MDLPLSDCSADLYPIFHKLSLCDQGRKLQNDEILVLIHNTAHIKAAANCLQ